MLEEDEKELGHGRENGRENTNSAKHKNFYATKENTDNVVREENASLDSGQMAN